jgi:hypothetical protein
VVMMPNLANLSALGQRRMTHHAPDHSQATAVTEKKQEPRMQSKIQPPRSRGEAEGESGETRRAQAPR